MDGEAEPSTGETLICDPVLQQDQQLIWSKKPIPCHYYRHCNIYFITKDLKDARDSSSSYIQLQVGESSLVSSASVPQNEGQFWQQGLMDISVCSLRYLVLLLTWSIEKGQSFRPAALAQTKNIETHWVWLGSRLSSLWLIFPINLGEVFPQQKTWLWDDKQSQLLHSPAGLWGEPSSWIPPQINIYDF